MGLDIYLYRYENKAEHDRRSAEYDAASDQNWKRFGDKKYEEFSKVELDQIRAANVAVAERLGVDEYGSDKTNETKIELDSAKYPEHLFKVGYFSSSYNDGGINRILNVRIGATLYTLFDNDNEYEFQPDWAEARRRTVSALEQLRAANTTRPYRAVHVGPNIFGGSTVAESEASALATFERVKGDQHSSGSFLCRDGDFWLTEPLHVRAAIFGKNALGAPCMYLVYEDTSENMRWYEEALEIVIETCDYVLAQPDQDKFWMHWSS